MWGMFFIILTKTILMGHNMQRFVVFLAMLFVSSFMYCQTSETSATYYESGVNSPWMIGLDYDFGFGKLFSINVQFAGGISSQVNRSSTFGDVFMGELQFGPRLYMNKFDTWEGVYLSAVGRVGIYNIPTRTVTEDSNTLVIDRYDMYQFGFGIYLGYKWTRNLVSDMTGMPFRLVLEPYLGWTMDFLHPFDKTFPNSGAVNRFSVGLTFKVGFFTYKKSAETLASELQDAEETADNTEEIEE